MYLCVQMESAWITVGKGSLWMRRVRTANRVTVPVVPVEGHNMTTVTLARMDTHWIMGSVWRGNKWPPALRTTSEMVRQIVFKQLLNVVNITYQMKLVKCAAVRYIFLSLGTQ